MMDINTRVFIADMETRLALLVEKYGNRGRCYSVREVGEIQSLQFHGGKLKFVVITETLGNGELIGKTRTYPIDSIPANKFERLLDMLIDEIKNTTRNKFKAIQNRCYEKLNKELER